jgi:hypothetical protein
VPSTGIFHVTLHNQTATSHLNMKTFFYNWKFCLCAYEKPTGDCCFLVDVTFTHFKLSGLIWFPVCSASLKIFTFSGIVNHHSSFPANLFVHVINLSVLQKGDREEG